MKITYAVLGAGRMGGAVAYDLARHGGAAEIRLADADLAAARAAAARCRSKLVKPAKVAVTDAAAVKKLLKGADVVVSAVPYRFNVALARAALAAKASFCDLGGNNDVVAEELLLDAQFKAAGRTLVPDCGLAPGMANVLAARAARRLDSVEALRIRVGGLPQKPEGPLRYQLVFSVGGLVNEYKEKCLVVRDGKTKSVEPLTEIEAIDFAAPFGRLEAFHTSGGLSTLPRTLKGRVRNMDYKTIRYEGHCEKMKLLLDLGFFDEEKIEPLGVSARAAAEAVLVRALAPKKTVPLDAVLVRITVEGTRLGRKVTLVNEIVDACDTKTGHTSMMRTTAYPAAIVAAMLGRREALREGAVPQENALPADAFVAELRRRGLPLVESEIDANADAAPGATPERGAVPAARGDNR